jgi:hypothetical protein
MKPLTTGRAITKTEAYVVLRWERKSVDMVFADPKRILD